MINTLPSGSKVAEWPARAAAILQFGENVP
jgi:hypothetical protein